MIINNKTANQYEYHERDVEEGVSPSANVSYMIDGKDLYITHVEVPTRFRGKGLGKRVLSEVLELIRVEGLNPIPKCSFAVDYFKKKGFTVETTR